MCYRCSQCNEIVPHGHQRLVHHVHRVIRGRTEIAAELPVCQDCHFKLAVLELSLDEVRHGKSIKLPTAPQETVKVPPKAAVRQTVPSATPNGGWNRKTIK